MDRIQERLFQRFFSSDLSVLPCEFQDHTSKVTRDIFAFIFLKLFSTNTYPRLGSKRGTRTKCHKLKDPSCYIQSHNGKNTLIV
jgi:hypothetical protein